MWVCFCEYVEGSGIVIWEFRIFGVWGLEYCLERPGLAPTAEEGDVMRLGICIYNVTIFEQENGKRALYIGTCIETPYRDCIVTDPSSSPFSSSLSLIST